MADWRAGARALPQPLRRQPCSEGTPLESGEQPASGRAPSVVAQPGRVDDAALHSTATVWYESTAAPRFGAASIRILTPGGAGTGGSTALTDGCVEAGGAANIRTNPGGEDTAGRLADICSVLLSRAQTRRTKALVGARETICPDPGRGTNQDAPANTARLHVQHALPARVLHNVVPFSSSPSSHVVGGQVVRWNAPSSRSSRRRGIAPSRRAPSGSVTGRN